MCYTIRITIDQSGKGCGAMSNKLEELMNTAKINELLHKKELEEKNKNGIIIALAIIGAVAAVAALFNGISQFWYLYSPRKIDFYHSLPVKRSRMFWHKTLQSLLYYLLPYLAMEFFSVCIGAMRGFFSLHISAFVFFGCVCNLHYRPSAYGSSSAYCSGCLWTGAFCYSAVLRKSLLLYQQCRCLWLYKRLERNGVTSHPCLHLCGKICRRKLWWHSGNCASGDNRFWRSWILCICKQKIRKNRYGLCFSMGWHNHKIYDCGSRRTWNRTYFLYASK